MRMTTPTTPPRSVLIVDDEPGIRTALTAHFSREGWQVTAASGLREAEYRLAQAEYDLMVSDVRLPDGSGVELMRALRAEAATVPIVLMTAFGSVPDAVEAMRGGASDYLTKPVAWTRLHTIAERLASSGIGAQTEMRSAQSAPDALTAARASDSHDHPPAHGIIGRSPALQQALTRARAAASTDADVLVEAESGTGKELLARFIHISSTRATKPFIAINCAAIPEHLLESELFGHARGAFTGATQARPGKFELAHGGTLLLDEIGEMPLHLQPKLLRALQEREFERLGETKTMKVDIRVIATTNVTLAEAVDRGSFRSDLYYRLNVIPLSLPPLRERKDDIPLLAASFAAAWAAREQRPVPALAPEFIEMLQAEYWAGNIRELGNFMQRVLSLHASERAGAAIDQACFRSEAAGTRKAPSSAACAAAMEEPELPPGVPIRQLERLHLEKTLALTQGNRTHAAEMLGISLRTMRNRIREYGLPPRRYA